MGEFKANKFSGQGTLASADGVKKIVGEWKDGKLFAEQEEEYAGDLKD